LIYIIRRVYIKKYYHLFINTIDNSYIEVPVTLEQIITVEAIIKEGSFKAAANYLHKSQPSISMAIKKLEEEYQVSLFSRDEYRPSLTNEGRIFYEKAQLLLKEFRELELMAKQMMKGEEAELRFSIDAVSPVSLILKFLNKFFKRHPNTRLQLRFEVLHGTLERLSDGDVDFAITPMIDNISEFDRTLLTTTKIIPVMRADFIKEKKITDEVLRDYTQIILSDSSRHSEKVTVGVLDGGKNIKLSEVSFKKEMILQGLGWGSLPIDMVKTELSKKILVPIKTNLIKEKEMNIYLVRNLKTSMGPVAKELWDKKYII
jgi:DNA-binding transcriptional LysR family regulator